MKRHADREHDRAHDQPDDARPRRDDADADAPRRRARSMPARAATEPVGQPRADDADDEDQHAVEQEDRPGTDVESLVDVQRQERAEPGERDQPEEQHRAGAAARRG